MSNRPDDPRWPKLLSLSVHEFRTPVTVVAGYIRMLLKDRAGAVTDQQRKLLEEAEKSCARLSGLLVEMSELGNLEAGTAPFNRSAIDLNAVIAEALSSLPPVPDRDITVTFQAAAQPLRVTGDPIRLKTAVSALATALRRELVTSTELFVRGRVREDEGRRVAWIAMGDADHIEAFAAAAPDARVTFDEWRGGVGLSLAVARRIVNAHDGVLWSPADGTKAGAMVALPM